jgi:hypothetical protein
VKQAPRCCVYTSLYGNLDDLPEQPVRAASNVDFIAFVGDPTRVSGTWTLRHLPPRLPGDPVRSARFAKLHPHLLLKDYDVSLYIDCTVLLKQPPEALFDALLFGRSETMACLRHSQRDNMPDEALAILDLGFDDPETCLRQLRAYADGGQQGTVALIWTGLLLRFHHRKKVVTMMERWWEHVLRYSRRDQLSFCYVAEILHIRWTTRVRSGTSGHSRGPVSVPHGPSHSPLPRARRLPPSRLGCIRPSIGSPRYPPSPGRHWTTRSFGWWWCRPSATGWRENCSR